MDTTPRLALPFLAPGQTEKEMLHNEALQVLDIMVAATVEQMPLSTPPASPVVGSAYIVGDDPSGDWADHAHQLASFTLGGWRFVSPREGMSVYVLSHGAGVVYRSGSWDFGVVTGSKVVIEGQQVVGPRLAAITTPTSGSVIDPEARAALVQVLDAMRQHGLIEA